MGNLFQIVYVALHQKPGGEDVLKEYNKIKGLSDPTRKKLVNILVEDLIESHGYATIKRYLLNTGKVSFLFITLCRVGVRLFHPYVKYNIYFLTVL